MTAAPRSVWSGVFRSFDEAATGDDIFATVRWRESVRAQFTAKTTEPQVDTGYPLAVLAATVAATSVDALGILDFGGGAGATYLECRARTADALRLDYRVVEHEDVCASGRDLARDLQELSFYSDLNTAVSGWQPQIVNIASTLHYIEDWQECLRRVCAQEPEWLVLGDVLAGDVVETFVSHQHYYGQVAPVWIWRETELLSAIAEFGFDPVYRAQFAARIAGRPGPLPMADLPAGRRLTHTLNYVFRRKD